MANLPKWRPVHKTIYESYIYNAQNLQRLGQAQTTSPCHF